MAMKNTTTNFLLIGLLTLFVYVLVRMTMLSDSVLSWKAGSGEGLGGQSTRSANRFWN